MLLATMMMYVRLWLLIFVLGYYSTAARLAGPFLSLALGSAVAAFILYRQRAAMPKATAPALKHPLELSTAALFAVLFAAFAALTQFVISHYGGTGLHVLSFVTGLTDIDPFILSLLAGKYTLATTQIAAAILIASGSNNLFKCGYALALGRNRAVLGAAIWLAILFAATIGYVFWIH